ncbi:NapC/NirT family cytochrome c [Motiliproteus sp. SC1-56]|uniref:NapC/NirT family cytochrome c n=1 Tax=Motiliproteus sp. SC1-56 TaxID=2799565 RepID=UPI001A8FB288|nr:NapC/NirT family cytochrome c [Motiliproteus sp. SC1-56]
MAKERKGMLARYWTMLTKPAGVAMGLILMGGFIAGIIFWGGFNTGLEMTNKEEFCIGCHEMRDNVYQELKETIHYTNRSGVRATCPDCHVPKEWTYKIIRKIAASREVWGKITGKIDTREKFQAHRGEMAAREWKRMKENDSRECRNCHNYISMDFSEQSRRGFEQHEEALGSGGKTCIDCHKGIAHQLPDMEGVEGWDG